MALRLFVGKMAYGILFVILCPLMLAYWALALDRAQVITWPVPNLGQAAIACLFMSVMLMASGVWALWHHGGGLPMNAFPPDKFVRNSVYGLFRHPIYFGFALSVFFAADFASSPAGFWMVAPIMTCAITAYVIGFEGPLLRARFGETFAAPIFGLPPVDNDRISIARRLALIVVIWAPWAIAYVLLATLPLSTSAVETRLAFEHAFPRPSWWLWVYTLAYPFVAFSPLAFKNNSESRRFVIGIWLATFLGFAVMLLIPLRATLLPMSDGVNPLLLSLNRQFDAEWLALPSFHVCWTIIAAVIYCRRWPLLTLPLVVLTTLIAVSCITTGSHSIFDVVAGSILALVAIMHEHMIGYFVQLGERVANSWHAWRIGPFRIISHAPWTAAATFVGMITAITLAGPSTAANLTIVLLIGLMGALIFGKLIEGRHLSRPYGYFGFLSAALMVLTGEIDNSFGTGMLQAAAIAAAAPLTQAIGRIRCLIQGCCHGGQTLSRYSITVRNPMSRVSYIAHLTGFPIIATQMISIVANLLTSALLLRLWFAGAQSTLVCGFYLIVTAIFRFAEEGLRAEPQTPSLGGLAIYQWLCVVIFMLGMFVTGVPSAAVVPALSIDATSVGFAVAVSILATILMSVDLPESGLPLSLLAPKDQINTADLTLQSQERLRSSATALTCKIRSSKSSKI